MSESDSQSSSPSPSTATPVVSTNNNNNFGGNHMSPVLLSLPATIIYNSEDELFDAIQTHARSTGQCFVKLRSTTHNDRKTVTYACDRCKKPKPAQPNQDESTPQRKRKDMSHRTDCQFSFLGVQLKDNAGWEVRYRPSEFYGTHNHPPSDSTSAHSGHRRLNQEAMQKVRELQVNGVHPRQAVTILRQTLNPDLLPHDIYNIYSSLKRAQVTEDGTVIPPARKRRSDAKALVAGGEQQTPIRPVGRGQQGNSAMGRNGPGRAQLLTSPLSATKYREIMIASGYSSNHSVIEVRNLASNALVGTDIWGGKDPKGRCNRFQPMLLSAKISLRNRFDYAAQNDRLDDGTVNYSTLSKTILKVLSSRGANRDDPGPLAGWPGLEIDWNVADLINWIFVYLTGRRANGSVPDAALAHSYIRGGCPCLVDGPLYEHPLLSMDTLQEMEMTLRLPKGTLLSEGVSLTITAGYLPGNRVNQSAPYSAVLKLENIKIPTLIGLNPNERLAKQMVIATVEIDPYVVVGQDHYNELEQIVVKSIEESAFETLESLAAHLVNRIIKHFIFPYTTREPFSDVRVSLVKPSATTFAEAPIVTVSRSSNPAIDTTSKTLWEEWLSWNTGVESRVPFPYQGRLDSWILDNFPGDSSGAQAGDHPGDHQMQG
ncbi:hypothetical protein VC83_09639 [Pseudogymnoascus destructans]|nr:uncharacterized protein VC83_09639 [Pseudogymnoascus destructans]PQM43512.1 hypothetical protein VC83_09639 [Pseudogymnoascus destructans]